MVENSLAFVEHGHCRIGIEKGEFKVVGCLYRISMILTFCRRCTLRLTVLYHIQGVSIEDEVVRLSKKEVVP